MGDLASKGDQARANILDAARQLFVQQGYHGTSMRDIAGAAGNRAVAGLYNHFPTKEAIFQALIAERNPYTDLFDLLEPIAARAVTAPDYVRQAITIVMQTMPRYFDFLQLAQIDVREFGGANMARMLHETGLPRLLELIERVQVLPGFKPMDGLVWVRLMASLMIGFMVTDQIAPEAFFGPYSHEQWAAFFADALLYGVADDR